MLEIFDVGVTNARLCVSAVAATKSIHRAERQAAFLTPRHDHTPSLSDRRIDSENTILESQRQLLNEP